MERTKSRFLPTISSGSMPRSRANFVGGEIAVIRAFKKSSAELFPTSVRYLCSLCRTGLRRLLARERIPHRADQRPAADQASQENPVRRPARRPWPAPDRRFRSSLRHRNVRRRSLEGVQGFRPWLSGRPRSSSTRSMFPRLSRVTASESFCTDSTSKCSNPACGSNS